MRAFVKINENDNVVVALKDLFPGEVITVNDQDILLKDRVKSGHKIAIQGIRTGENVIKYGYPIGHGTEDILPGTWVHTHNVKTNLDGINEYSFQPKINASMYDERKITFGGYVREDSNVGIRNELWIVPTVGCVNGIAESMIRKLKEEVGVLEIDAIEVFRHNYGCSQLGEDHLNTKTILGDIVRHPNAGGVLVLGLGCENNHMSAFQEFLGKFNEKRVRFLVAQDVEDEIAVGVSLLRELYEQMRQDVREAVPISSLKIGLKCGGSDGLSGITANPLLGGLTDLLISQGGTAVLTEVPEMFGAETILMNRCINKDIFDKTVHLINDFKEYFLAYNQVVYENPSPGNKAGGISTLEDKSLGCTQKGGTVPVVDVLRYGEVLTEKGLNLLSAPGNDLVSCTALGAAGCQLILFTTGRGTPFGSFVPTMKISTNSPIYELKKHWIDFDAGMLLDGQNMDALVEELFQQIIQIASGKLVNNEKNDIREISVFKTGVTM